MYNDPFCYICNGLNQPQTYCPSCGAHMEDYGPISYYLSDYSPYRPMDDMKKNDGLWDLEPALCPHQLYCLSCSWTEIVNYQEMALKNRTSPQ